MVVVGCSSKINHLFSFLFLLILDSQWRSGTCKAARSCYYCGHWYFQRSASAAAAANESVSIKKLRFNKVLETIRSSLVKELRDLTRLLLPFSQHITASCKLGVWHPNVNIKIRSVSSPD